MKRPAKLVSKRPFVCEGEFTSLLLVMTMTYAHNNFHHGELMKLTLSVPDHTTVSRRVVTLPVTPSASIAHGPLHVLIDSTGLQVFGAGQWLEAKHGAKSRRTWRKLHLAVDAAKA